MCWLILSLSGPPDGYLQALAVPPDWRCRGIGTRIIAWAEARNFRQSLNIFLCVSSFNLRKTRGQLSGFKPGE